MKDILTRKTMSQSSNYIGDMFASHTLEFQEKFIDGNLIAGTISDSHFGILNLKAISADHNNLSHDFVFMVDRSASMEDRCGDGKTKMQHICHILKNMVSYFKEHPTIRAHITICTFDDVCDTILERVVITDTNFSKIITTIDEILPRGSTNIEAAIQHINQCCSTIRAEFPTHNICSVFMTDGQVTTGNPEVEVISGLIDRTIDNTFIGVGLEHDGTLLSTLGSGQNCNYYFIDKLENSGFVYGEIIHGVIYKMLANVKLTIEFGLLYDFKNNKWVSSIDIGNVVGESDKVYHVSTHAPDACWVSVSGNKLDGSALEPLVAVRKEGWATLDKYIYRQRTLQHLYNINDFVKRQYNNNDHNLFGILDRPATEQPIIDEQKQIRDALHAFIDEMKTYMTANNLIHDSFMKNLCDDIYICYRTFTTKYASMYVAARQSSQGAQRCYTVNHTPQDDAAEHMYRTPPRLNRKGRGMFPPPPALTRSNPRGASLFTFPDLENACDDDITHKVARFDDTQSPYRTPGTVTLMRALSNAPGKNDDDDEIESQCADHM
jgi:hypothetical protein